MTNGLCYRLLTHLPTSLCSGDKRKRTDKRTEERCNTHPYMLLARVRRYHVATLSAERAAVRKMKNAPGSCILVKRELAK